MSRLWTEEEDSLLRDICASGEQISAPKIAVRLSKTFAIAPPRTKAAVVGRARRLKLDLPLPCDRERKIGYAAMATTQHNGVSISPRYIRPAEPDPRQTARGNILPEHPRAKGVYLLNSSDLDCKRPITDPPAGQRHLLRVCGEPIARRVYAGVGYCEACLGRMLSKGEAPSGQPFVLPGSGKKRG
jgi:hypothetical protein